jgi:hypothetical protein
MSPVLGLMAIPLKSVLCKRSLKKKTQADFGCLARRSSLMGWVWTGVGTLS